MTKRVVVTAMGLVSPLGNTVSESWNAVLQGHSGIESLEELQGTEFRTTFAGRIKNFEASDFMAKRDVRRYDPFVHYALAAAHEATEQANLEGVNLDRVGVLFGSGIGGIGTLHDNAVALANTGPRRVSPMFIPGSIINMPAGLIAITHGFKGPNLAVTTACTTSAHAIGVAARLIQCSDADVMIAGGAEAGSHALGLAGFASMQALSSKNDTPKAASRPFDLDRDGFVMGDGAGVLVLESMEHAKARGATILAELVGFGMSDDAHHITAPPQSGEGAQLAMKNALANAGIEPSQVGYINAHGTSTPLGDVAETKAINAVFGERQDLCVGSTKSMTGHLLGAAGAAEAIFSILALRESVVPPTINLENQDPECKVFVPTKPHQTELNYVLSNSFGFGGTNGSLIFGKAD